MPGNRNTECEAEVKILVRLAVARGIARIPEKNAGRTRMEQLVESLRSHAGEHGWSGGEETEFDGAVAATWPATVVQNSAPTQEDSAAALPAAPAEKAVEWKSAAVHATYNCTRGDWASTEKGVQIKLSQRGAT